MIGTLPEPHSAIDFSQEAALFGGAKTQLDALTARFKESGDKTEQCGFWETVRVLKSVHESIDDKVDATRKRLLPILKRAQRWIPSFWNNSGRWGTCWCMTIIAKRAITLIGRS